MDLAALASGKEMRIEYPSHNRLDLPLEYVWRHIRVVTVRDYRKIPLSTTGFVSRPLVRRGSILIVANDLELPGEPERKFWLEAIRTDGELPCYQLGLYDPEEPDDAIDWLGKPFRPRVNDRLRMRDAIKRFYELENARGPCGLKLAAFAVEDSK
jgi:hypothetical protein